MVWVRGHCHKLLLDGPIDIHGINLSPANRLLLDANVALPGSQDTPCRAATVIEATAVIGRFLTGA